MDTTFRIGLSVLTAILCLIPTWIWLAFNHWIQPTGFWQKALMIGVGLWIGGAVQFFLLFLLIGVLFYIWTEL